MFGASHWEDSEEDNNTNGRSGGGPRLLGDMAEIEQEQDAFNDETFGVMAEDVADNQFEFGSDRDRDIDQLQNGNGSDPNARRAFQQQEPTKPAPAPFQEANREIRLPQPERSLFPQIPSASNAESADKPHAMSADQLLAAVAGFGFGQQSPRQPPQQQHVVQQDQQNRQPSPLAPVSLQSLLNNNLANSNEQRSAESAQQQQQQQQQPIPLFQQVNQQQSNQQQQPVAMPPGFPFFRPPFLNNPAITAAAAMVAAAALQQQQQQQRPSGMPNQPQQQQQQHHQHHNQQQQQHQEQVQRQLDMLRQAFPTLTEAQQQPQQRRGYGDHYQQQQQQQQPSQYNSNGENFYRQQQQNNYGDRQQRPQWRPYGGGGGQYGGGDFQQQNQFRGNSGDWDNRDRGYGGGGYNRGGYNQQMTHYERRMMREREDREKARRALNDDYAGLMTWREKLTVLRIQLLQIIGDRGPAGTTFFYEKMLSEKRVAKMREEESSSTTTSPPLEQQQQPAATEVTATAATETQTQLEDSLRFQRELAIKKVEEESRRRQRTISSSSTVTNAQVQPVGTGGRRIPIPRLTNFEIQPYKPVTFEGSLGKWSASSVSRPRQILDLAASGQDTVEALDKALKDPHTSAELVRMALGVVEALYNCVLEAENISRQLAEGPPKPLDSASSAAEDSDRDRRFAFDNIESGSNSPNGVFDDPQEWARNLELRLVQCRQTIARWLLYPSRLALVIAIRKGRRVLPRAIKLLGQGRLVADSFEIAFQLTSHFCDHLALLIRREPIEASLVSVVEPLCALTSDVKSVLSSGQTSTSSSQLEALGGDFVPTVRNLLKDKSLATRSPRLISLLTTMAR